MLYSVIITADMVGPEKKEECPVESSTDAGRFVCNFVYYWSLKKARQTRQKIKGADVDVKSLFIHVPMFSVMDFPLQSRIVRLVLQVLLESELGSASTLTGNIDLKLREEWPGRD
jgi:pyrrolidone-carboxylate peptidase